MLGNFLTPSIIDHKFERTFGFCFLDLLFVFENWMIHFSVVVAITFFSLIFFTGKKAPSL